MRRDFAAFRVSDGRLEIRDLQVAISERQFALFPISYDDATSLLTESALYQASKLPAGHRQHRQVDRLRGFEVGH